MYALHNMQECLLCYFCLPIKLQCLEICIG